MAVKKSSKKKSTPKKSTKKAQKKTVSPEKTQSSRTTSAQKRKVSSEFEKSLESTIEAAVECCASKKTHACGSSCSKKSFTSSCGGVYGLGFVGALVYYIVSATSFWGGVLGVLKAIIWPAMLVFKLLGM